MYEAALGRNAEKLEQTLLDEYPGPGEHKRGRRAAAWLIAKQRNVGWTELLADKAMWEVLQFVVHGVRAFAYPDVAFPSYFSAPHFKKLPFFTHERISRSWGARNLLGAIYLQFYWLVTSGEAIIMA
jgi:hypothetical protein